MEKTLWNVRLIKKLFQVEKKLRHRPNERSDKKKREQRIFNRISKCIKSILRMSMFHIWWNSSDVCVCVRECDLGWLWEKWLLTQNSYRFDMVRWWWHNFVLLFFRHFFFSFRFFSDSFLCAYSYYCCSFNVVMLECFLSIFLHRAIELMPIWWSSISSDFSFSLNIKWLSHILFHTLI